MSLLDHLEIRLTNLPNFTPELFNISQNFGNINNINNTFDFEINKSETELIFGREIIKINETDEEKSNKTSITRSPFCINKENPSFSTNSITVSQITEFGNRALRLPKLEKEKIFRVTKRNRKIGRLKKDCNLDVFAIHTKFTEDNIIRKFKARFIERCRQYLNKLYHEYDDKKILLQKISPVLGKKIIKEENLKFLKMKLKDVFSEKVSPKCSLYKPYDNKNEISKLFEKNEAKKVIDILNKSVKEMIEYYLGKQELPEFGTIEEDIKEFKEIDSYKKEYRRVAENFENIFNKKHSRRNK